MISEEERQLKLKLRHIHLPLLITAVGFIVIYTLVNWLFFINLDIFPIKRNLTDILLPVALSWIAVLIWIRPGIKLLAIRNDNYSMFLHCFAWAAIAVPTVILQPYIEQATGEITQLASISKINDVRETKYYTVRDCYISKPDGVSHLTLTISGRYRQNLDMRVYVAFPIWPSEADAADPSCPAWLGLEYKNTINSHLSDEEKEGRIREFQKKIEADVNGKNLGQFIFLERPESHTDASDGFQATIKKSPKYNPMHTAVLIPHDEAFDERTSGRLAWVLLSLFIFACVWFLMLLPFEIVNSKTMEERRRHVFSSIKYDEDINWKEVLIPHRGFFATPILIYINALVFLIMVFDGMGLLAFQSDDLLRIGAAYGPAVRNGEWWRLLSCMFIHTGAMHILANMYALFIAGLFLEPEIGTLRFFYAYFVSGILASCACIWWQPDAVAVGASGAIFGIYGVMLVLLLTKTLKNDVMLLMRGSLLSSVAICVVVNLILGFVVPGVANAAHICGLLSGIAIGLVYWPILRKRNEDQVANANYK